MKLHFIFLIAALPAFAATCPLGTTHIVDTLLAGDGVTPAYGKILAKGPSSPSGSILSTTTTITIGTGGVVDFCLVGGPAVKYATTYLLTTSTGKATTSYSEAWFPPATTSTLTIKQLWGGSSAPQFLISPQQINPAGYTAGQVPLWDGSSWIPATNAAGGAGMADPGSNGVLIRSALNTTAVVPGVSTDCVRVNGTSGACGAGGAGTWGSITGSPSAQTDLMALLNAKLTAASNLSDLPSATAARANLGLGGAALLSVGAIAGTVAAGNDARLADARTPNGTASGDLTGTYPSPTLPTVNASVGTCGVDATHVGQATYDAKGRVTGCTPVLITASGALPAGVTSDGANGLNVTGSVKVGTRVLAQGSDGYVDPLLAVKQAALTLTTTGTSGAATLAGGALNIPQYAGGVGSGITTMTTGAADPVSSCTAPSSANLALYTQTTSQDLWVCVATNLWKKLPSTTNIGTWTVTGTTGTAPARPAAGNVTCYYDSTDNLNICLDSGTQTAVQVKSAGARVANQFVTHVDAHGVAQQAAISSADLPFPGPAAKGAVLSTLCLGGQVTDGYQADGTPHCVVAAGASGATANQNIRTIGFSWASATDPNPCVLVQFSGTINRAITGAESSGNATIDITSVAMASWTGSASASTSIINAGTHPSLAAGVYVTVTSIAGWTAAGAVTADTWYCGVLTGATAGFPVHTTLKVVAN